MAIRKRYLIGDKSSGAKSGGVLNINPFSNAIFKRRRSFLRIGISGIFALLFLFFVGGAGAFVYFAKDLPNPASLGRREVTESTKIYDRTGKILLYEIHGEERRTVVPLNEISPHLKNAAIATEDKDFYSHEGVDFNAVVRALWKDMQAGGIRQGGSTITQQLIKKSILTDERTISRKIKELILAIELEQKFSKDQILEMYLNQIPYGSNAYGAEAAARTFFKKSAKDLTIGEAAVLAALPKAPTYYSPWGTHQKELKGRVDYVIDRMEQQKYITPDEAKAAKDENTLSKITRYKEKMLAPHFTTMVREYLADKYGDKTLEKGGLKVITTVDMEKQKIAEEAIKTNIEKNAKKYNVHNAALAAVDPANGHLLALVGSKDPDGDSFPAGCAPGKDCLFDPYTNAAVSPLPPGSSFKPFVYAALFKKGFTPNSVLFDLDTEFNVSCTPDHKPNAPYVRPEYCYDPRNFDGKFRGPVSIRDALAQSLNVPAVKAFYVAGIGESIETARDFGMASLDKKDDYNLTFVLGGGGVKLLEQTAAYGVFANDGIKNGLKMVLKVTSSDGAVLEDNESKKDEKEVLDKNIAREITDILSDNNARTPVFGANSPLYFPNRPVAAKTGTADDYRHAWTFGYTPSLAVGVWAGNNNNSKMNRAGGVSAAAPIWREFMAKALEGDPVQEFIKPEIPITGKPILDGKFDGGMTVKIDKACGDKLAKPDTPQYRVEDRNYKSAHNILYYVDPKDPLGPLPAMPENDPQFANWEDSVSVWARGNGYDANQAPPKEYCEAQNYENPRVSIISPKNGENINPPAGQNAPAFNLKIEADIFIPAGVNQANFFFDGGLIGTRSSAPWAVNFPVSKNISSGEHKISVRVFDGSNNETKDEIKVNFNLDFDPPKIYLREPLCGKPVCFLSATANDDKSGVSEVEFYYRKGGANISAKIPGQVSSDGDLYQIIWQTGGLDLGNYDIWAKARDNSGNEATSQIKRLEIQ